MSGTSDVKWLVSMVIVAVTMNAASSSLLQALYNSDEPLLLDEQKSRRIAEDWAKGKSKASGDKQQHFLPDIGYNYDDDNAKPGTEIGGQQNTGQETSNKPDIQIGTSQHSTGVEKELKDVFRNDKKSEDPECPKDIPVYREYGNGKCATQVQEEQTTQGKDTVITDQNPQKPSHQLNQHLFSYIEQTSGNQNPIIPTGSQKKDDKSDQQETSGHFKEYQEQDSTGISQINANVDTSFEDQFGLSESDRIRDQVVVKPDDDDQFNLDQSQQHKESNLGQVTQEPIRLTEDQQTDYSQFDQRRPITNLDQAQPSHVIGYFNQLAQKPLVFHQVKPTEEQEVDRFREQQNVDADSEQHTNPFTEQVPDKEHVSNIDQESSDNKNEQNVIDLGENSPKPGSQANWDSSESDRIDNGQQQQTLNSYEETGHTSDVQQQQQQQTSGNRFREDLDQQITVNTDQKPERTQIFTEQHQVGNLLDQNNIGHKEEVNTFVDQQVIPNYGQQNVLPVNERYASGGGQTVGGYRPNQQHNQDIIYFPDDDFTGHRPWEHHRPGDQHDQNDYGFNCYGKKAGYYPSYEHDCHYFYRCDEFGKAYQFRCAKGTLFNALVLKCLHAGQVKCR